MNRRAPLVALALLAAACGSPSSPSEPPAPSRPTVVAGLRADANRDGEVRFDDTDANTAPWDRGHGAIFLANIDDDKGRCPKTGDDVTLPNCNDATDEVVDGDDDALDLARLKVKPWPEAPDTAQARITASAAARDFVRLFRRVGPGAADFEALGDDGALTLDELRSGVELAIEGKDVVRDKDVWDGLAEVTLTVTVGEDKASDAVAMRMAPIVTYHHLLAEEQVFVTNDGTAGNRLLRNDLAAACKDLGLSSPVEVADDDPWAQDFFETAFMSMPGAGGAQHAIHVNLRSANVYDPANTRSPLRPAGQVVFASFRGKDTAGVQQYDLHHSQDMDSLNSFGNTETIPPYTLGGQTYPLGRILRGATPTFFPDKTFTTLLTSQVVQPLVEIDTSWLLVGHVDETLSFVKASTPRGWVLLVNDPTLARKMLEDQVTAGNGATPMFVGEQWFDDKGKASPAETTIAKVLADTVVMAASADAAVEVEGQVRKLAAETGLTDAEIIKVPFLHTTTQGKSYAYIPGMVNGIYLADGTFLAPRPHGPVIDGKDLFEQAMIAALKPVGITVRFAEDWEYHASLGEVHCGTNSRRKLPDARWWESGR